MSESDRNRSSRRKFLKAAGTTTAASLVGIPESARAQATVDENPASSKSLNIGLIGCGQRMDVHCGALLARDDAQILAVCDVFAEHRTATKNKVENAYAAATASGAYNGCDAYNEFERILERGDIDAVMIATPDHWHAAITIAAMRAGKDVYCEAPLSLTINEGRMVADVAAETARIVQVGAQGRSSEPVRRACEIIRSGWLGKVTTIDVALGEMPPPLTPAEEPIPNGFDYDRWLGPAPFEPFSFERINGSIDGWRRFWAYSGRENSERGAHLLDIVQSALGKDNSGPIEAIPADEKETRSRLRYSEEATVFKNTQGLEDYQVRFVGEKGTVTIKTDGSLLTEPAELAARPPGKDDVRLPVSADHLSNWLDAVRTREPAICPAKTGHRTATACHLLTIAERLNRPIRWDAAKEEILDDPYASRWLERQRRSPWFI